MTDRRTFLKTSATVLTGVLATGATYCTPPKRSFLLSVNAGNIGVDLPLPVLMDKAAAIGFEAVSPSSHTLLQLGESGIKEIVEMMNMKQLSWGAGGLPMEFRKDETTFKQDLAELPKHAEAYMHAGVNRIGTWIMPTHPDLSYMANFQQHIERLGQVAEVLSEYEIRLGLEYVAPKTLMARDRYPFIHTMGELRAMIAEMGADNVGLILDAFHWYCAEDTVEDLLALQNSHIVAVDLNDATAGRSRDEQLDGERQLPLASGLIDLKAFMQTLAQIGYDGPVRAEPFNQPLRDMPDEQALQTTYEAMKKAVDLAE